MPVSRAAIVVGTDGSATAGRAVRHAAELAAALGAPLHVAMCCEPLPKVLMSAAGAPYGAMINLDEVDPREYANKVVDRARYDLLEHGVEVETHVREGEPAETLMSLAAELEAQMIVVGSRGMQGVRRMLGSVPNRVSHHARCAVMIVPTGEPAPPA